MAWQATWVGPLFAVLAVLTVLWAIYLAMSLPQRQVALHYATAWAGFDIALAVALGATAWTAWRRSRWLPIAAAGNATLLGTDAWFDIVTSVRPMERDVAIASAVIIEIPLLCVCVWIALHAQNIIEGRLEMHLRPGHAPDPADAALDLERAEGGVLRAARGLGADRSTGPGGAG